MAKIPPYLLNLAGEYRICSELNKRGVFATVTYGNRKAVDVYAISDRQQRALKIEVKTSQQGNFVTGIAQKGFIAEKGLVDDPHAPDFWVLFQVRPGDDGTFAERFFILTHQEICELQAARNKVFADSYFKRHGKVWDPMKGVDNVTVADVEKYEDQWAKIIERLGGPAAEPTVRQHQMTMDAFAGIDVAFQKGKRLPVAVCTWDADRFVPLPVTGRDAPHPPRGAGNAAALDSVAVTRFADDTATYLRLLEAHFGVRIRRVAIDAPSDPRADKLKRRRAEEALDARRVNCFATPSAAEFVQIREKVRAHLRAGGAKSRLPHANQLWMLVGFALFERLRHDWECLEVFPQATVRALGAGATHKSKPGGVLAQLAAVARLTGWPSPPTESALRTVAYGPTHDRLDAYLAAWVAGLQPDQRSALGDPPHDVIWIPSLGAAP
jgi:hypothetical protein